MMNGYWIAFAIFIEIDDAYVAKFSSLEIPELRTDDASTLYTMVLVCELGTIAFRDNQCRKRTDAMSNNKDPVSLPRGADVLSASGSEIGFPRVVSGLGRKSCRDDLEG
ncbi:MAG: hypothetical protein R3B65_01935 [Candidatus Paceibacterota bacterium]